MQPLKCLVGPNEAVLGSCKGVEAMIEATVSFWGRGVTAVSSEPDGVATRRAAAALEQLEESEDGKLLGEAQGAEILGGGGGEGAEPTAAQGLW